jgi:hypothetical protein
MFAPAVVVESVTDLVPEWEPAAGEKVGGEAKPVAAAVYVAQAVALCEKPEAVAFAHKMSTVAGSI